MRTWKRLSAVGAAAALLGGLSLVAATPAQAAGTTLKLDRVRCIVETDEVGSDSPYVIVFATSPTNSQVTAFGKWGPGGWDNVVDTGDTYYPNGTVTWGVQPGWTLWTVLMEEDNGADMGSGDLAYIESRLYNEWQAAFWEPALLQQLSMSMMFATVIGDTEENDDLVAIRKTTITSSSSGVDVPYNGDGGAYWLRFKLV